MTVKELIEELKQMPEDLPVEFRYYDFDSRRWDVELDFVEIIEDDKVILQ
jgi:hypothetical protein